MSRENGGGGDMVEEEESGISGGEYKRHKVVGFVGIQTGFGSVARWRSLRRTRFHSDHNGIQKYSLFFC